MSLFLQPPVTQLLFNQRIQVNNKDNIKTLYLGRLSGPVDSLHKTPVMRKAFPYYDINIDDEYGRYRMQQEWTICVLGI